MPLFKNQGGTDLDKGDRLAIREDLTTERKPRICMVTTRNFARQTFMCGFYEGQDILVDIDDVDLIYLEPKKAYGLRRDLQERLIWNDPTKKVVMTNMTCQPVTLTKEYDLFIAYFCFMGELIHLPAIQGWQDHCKKSICWINELWMNQVIDPRLSSWLPALDQFDHVVSGLNMTAKGLGDALKRPCEFLPSGIDAWRFSPYPKPPARVIDMYSMGRTAPGLHANLLQIATQENRFYLYDTFNATEALVRDYRQHRELFANIAKRTRYFVVSAVKKPISDALADQVEVPARYYEAVAAGAVLLGETPNCAAFNELFNWPDAVIEVQANGSDVADVLASLAAQPDRLREISQRNAREALLRHDWVYRWRHILQMSGLTVTPKLELRENTLAAMALNITVEDH